MQLEGRQALLLRSCPLAFLFQVSSSSEVWQSPGSLNKRWQVLAPPPPNTGVMWAMCFWLLMCPVTAHFKERWTAEGPQALPQALALQGNHGQLQVEG